MSPDRRSGPALARAGVTGLLAVAGSLVLPTPGAAGQAALPGAVASAALPESVASAALPGAVARAVLPGVVAPAEPGRSVALPGVAGPADAPRRAAPVGRRTDLRMTVRSTAGDTTRVARLVCFPAGGTHPNPADACAAMAAASGDFAALAPMEGVMCTMEYRPVTATGKGWWKGRWVWYRETFSNSCVMRAETGGVFGF